MTTRLHQLIPSNIRADKKLHDTKCSKEVIEEASTTLTNLLKYF